MQDGKEIFKGFVKTIKKKVRDWESRHLWAARWLKRIFVYGFLLLLFSLAFYLNFSHLNLFHTDVDSARYMLSALVQSQAAIVAIVISLTLIAVQLTASAYSPRVIDIFKKNLDMWILLACYGISIFYGLLVLKLVEGAEGELVSQSAIWSVGRVSISFESYVSIAYWLGAFTFVVLIPYMRNIMDLLKPESIINRLTIEITKDNLLNSKEDSIQPVMDIVHGSIMKYDIETTRVGLKAVTDRIIKVIDSDGEVKISDRFCDHLHRVSRFAASRADDESTSEVIENLEKFGRSTAEKGFEYATALTAEFLEAVGNAAAEKGLVVATLRALESLEAVGVTATEKGLEKTARHAALYLGQFGKSTAEKGLGGITKQIARSLGDVGKAVAEKRLGDATVQAAESLGDVGRTATEKGLEAATKQAAESLAELTILSGAIVKTAIQDYESNLEEQYRDSFLKFMEIYRQELEKL